MGNQNASIERMRVTVRAERDDKVKFHLAKLRDLHSKLKISEALEQKILHAPVSELVDMLNKRKINSIQLVVVFGIRAMTVGKDYNLIT